MEVFIPGRVSFGLSSLVLHVFWVKVTFSTVHREDVCVEHLQHGLHGGQFTSDFTCTMHNARISGLG